MSNNSEQDHFFEIENDKISNVEEKDMEEKKTDEEMSFNFLETKRKTLSTWIALLDNQKS